MGNANTRAHTICPSRAALAACGLFAVDGCVAVPMIRRVLSAPVAELVDAADSKSVARKGVLVRFRPGAPLILI
jgi:hypothetical protein